MKNGKKKQGVNPDVKVEKTGEDVNIKVSAEQLEQMRKSITSEAVIKNCKITKQCAKMDFIGFQLTGQDYVKVTKLIQKQEKVAITIMPLQGELFD